MVFWIIRITEYDTFRSLNKKHIWVYDAKNQWNCKKFHTTVKKGDIIWFVRAKSQGHILGLATFQNKDELPRSLKSKLALPESLEDANTQIHYNKFYHLEELELQASVRFARDFFQVDKDKHQEVHQMLGNERAMILRYSTLKRQMP